MLVIFRPINEAEVIREHPWSDTEYDEQGGAYYDFTKHPELIPTVLEDFVPYANRDAVKRFYEFLAWINGPVSALETNDCGFRGPARCAVDLFRATHSAMGRVEFFFRSHARNLNQITLLMNLFCLYLQVHRTDFHSAVFTIGVAKTGYVDLPQIYGHGYRIRVEFTAYGNSEVEVFDNLLVTIDAIWKAAKRTNDALSLPLPEFP